MSAPAKPVCIGISRVYHSTYVTLMISSNIKRMATRSLSSQSCVSMSAFSHMSDNDPEVLEKEKHKTLNKRDKEWSEKLASHSEAVVKAEKEHDKPIKDMQNETIEHFEKKKNEDN